MLTHELTHAQRYDLWAKLLLIIGCSVHWFNPLIHWMAKQACREMEYSCDERVMQDCDMKTRKAYSLTILHAMSDKWASPLTTCLGKDACNVKERFAGILDSRAKKTGIFAVISVVVLVGLIGGGVAIGSGNKRGDAPTSSELERESMTQIAQPADTLVATGGNTATSTDDVAVFDALSGFMPEEAIEMMKDSDTERVGYFDDGVYYRRILDGQGRTTDAKSPRGPNMMSAWYSVTSDGALSVYQFNDYTSDAENWEEKNLSEEQGAELASRFAAAMLPNGENMQFEGSRYIDTDYHTVLNLYRCDARFGSSVVSPHSGIYTVSGRSDKKDNACSGGFPSAVL